MKFMTLPFIKMHGLGNSYIFVEADRSKRYSHAKLAVKLSDTNYGIGADGMIMLDTSAEPFLMRIFNRDGSEAELCGNGLRQAALYLKKTKFPRRKNFLITTMANEYETRIKSSKSNDAVVATSLGSPDFSSRMAGLKGKETLALDVSLFKYGTKDISIDCVNMGNPHAVVFVVSYDFDWPRLGKSISQHQMFSHGINISFVRIINSKRFEIKTFERGTGITSACGSGAAASLAAGVMRNVLQKKAVAVMTGGNLELSWEFSTNTIYQVGPATMVCYGEYCG